MDKKTNLIKLLVKALKYSPSFLGKTTIKRKMLFLMAGLVTITPTILIALLASTYYYLGIESLFNEKISSSLAETVKVAELYLEEHRATVKVDITSISNLIEKNSYLFSANPSSSFNDLWNTVNELYSNSEGMIFTRDNVIISKTPYSLSIYFEKIPTEALDSADHGEIVVIGNKYDERVRAITKLNFPPFEGTYLLICRDIDPNILNHLKSTQGSQAQYQSLLSDIHQTQVKLQIAFIFLSVLLCTIAIIVAIRLSKKIAKPINQLVLATAEVKDGNFAVRVPERPGQDETAILARAFNQMTQHIEQQTKRLMEVNAIIDERRRFIETVLREISAGLLVINPAGYITLCNQAAAILLRKSETELLKRDYHEHIEPISDLIAKAGNSPGIVVNGNILIKFKDTETPIFVRVGTEVDQNYKIISYIVTMDDMTTLVAAQRAAAWGEVAKRIAHEIKNPLTPINLAAERLIHKFSSQVTTDNELFTKYVNTIIHHVEDIGNIVEEFVRFAKIPAPKMEKINIVKLAQDILFSHKDISPDISFILDSNLEECIIYGDKTQLSQVMVNLVKNAIESIDSRLGQDDRKTKMPGKITIKLRTLPRENIIELQVSDNGIGIPEKLLNNIQDPYVTTKANGTGLGLAIVKKIIEDHGGLLTFNNTKQGACFVIKLPNQET